MVTAITSNTKIKIGAPMITTPNMIGEVIRETPKMLIVKIIERTFEPKSSSRFTHKFSKSERKWFSDKCGFIQRFWKESNLEVGGNNFIIKKLN